MIHRFLKDATGCPFANTGAVQVLKAVAGLLNAQPRGLDHAIWRYQPTIASTAWPPKGPHGEAGLRTGSADARDEHRGGMRHAVTGYPNVIAG